MLNLKDNDTKTNELIKTTLKDAIPDRNLVLNQRINTIEKIQPLKSKNLNHTKDISNFDMKNENLTRMNENKYIKSTNYSLKETIRTFVIKNIQSKDLKGFYNKSKNIDKKEINYKDFLLFFNIGDSLNAKSFFEAISEQHIIIISSTLIYIMNHSDCAFEEKFKFAFLILDEESSGYLSINELEKLIKINFLFKQDKDIKNKTKIIKEKYSLINMDNNDTFEFENLLITMKKFTNLFYPTN